ncbi:MAG TPA: hypothetical protein PK691_05485 [Thermomicrobiales bacterium]|nr:hypothetical protein [Thermomicrobiales bacterium]HRA49036.1 hypothetical protein [Thermomicrobiales bacterium]
MFRIAALPQLPGRRMNPSRELAADQTATAVITRRPATADVRIRRFEQSGVTEETYSAILPGATESPIDLMRVITEACKDLPEFQIRNKDDEQFVLTLTLKA